MRLSIMTTVVALAAMTLPAAAKEKTAGTIGLTSDDFKHGADLPQSATCDGEGKSPELTWKNSTPAKSFALIVDDPDAPKGPYVHWVLFDIPGGTNKIARDSHAGTVGTNSADKTAYAPACPPRGSGVHHYNFHIYALDVAAIGALKGASRDNVMTAMKGHVVADSVLTGTYERR